MKRDLFILLIFISFFSHAQVAGYMGKRFVLGYSNYFMIGLKGPGAINAGPSDESSPTLNNVHCLNLEYVYKQNKIVCLSGQYLRTGIAYDKGTYNDGLMGFFSSSGREYPYPNGSKYIGNYSKPALLSSVNFSFGLKSFKRGFVAPVGRYRKMEVVLLFETVKYDYKNFAQPDPNSSSSEPVRIDLGSGQYSYRNVSFAYSFGKQRILNDKFVLDYGIRFAYTPAINIITIAVAEEYITTVENYYRRVANLRIARQQLINFHLGIGFLAF